MGQCGSKTTQALHMNSKPNTRNDMMLAAFSNFSSELDHSKTVLEQSQKQVARLVQQINNTMKAMPDVYDVAEDGTISAVEMDGERVIVPPAITDESVSLHQQVITPIMHWQAELNAAKGTSSAVAKAQQQARAARDLFIKEQIKEHKALVKAGRKTTVEPDYEALADADPVVQASAELERTSEIRLHDQLVQLGRDARPLQAVLKLAIDRMAYLHHQAAEALDRSVVPPTPTAAGIAIQHGLDNVYAPPAPEETPSTPRALPSTETNNGPITNGITTPETTTFTKPTPFTNTNAIPSYEPSTPNAVNGKGNGYAYNGQQQQEQDDMPQAPTTTYRKTTTTLAPISTQQNPISA